MSETQEVNVKQGNIIPTAADLLVQETLTEEELAKALGVLKQTVANLRLSGKLPYVFITAQRRVYRLEDVRKWMADSVVKSNQ